MGSKAAKRARRLADAKWREFCDSWVNIGAAADRELRDLRERKVAPGPSARRAFRRSPALSMALSFALMGCAANPDSANGYKP